MQHHLELERRLRAIGGVFRKRRHYSKAHGVGQFFKLPIGRANLAGQLGCRLVNDAAQQRGGAHAFANHTHVDKIRVAKNVTQTIISNNDLIKSNNGMMNTVLGLLAKGDINCAGEAVDPNGDLFGPQKPAAPVAADRKPRQATETDPGVIRTQREKEQADEEIRRKKEEEEREKAEQEAKRKEEEERIRKENSRWNKFKKGAAKFIKGMVEEEE